MNIPPSMFAAISPLYPTSNKNIKLTAIKCKNISFTALTIKFQSQHFYEHQNKIEIIRKNKNENKQNSKANIN